MKKRFLCLALVLVMLVGIIPFSAITAFAADPTSAQSNDVETVTVTTFDELREALGSDGEKKVVLGNDISIRDPEFNVCTYATNYNGDRNLIPEGARVFNYYGDDTAAKALVNDYIVDTFSIDVKGTKTLDLNGHDIFAYLHEVKYYDLSSRLYQETMVVYDATLFDVKRGATLNLDDTSEGTPGNIFFDGYMYDTIWADSFDYAWEWEYRKQLTRDIFLVSGTLNVFNGIIEAGRSKEQWIVDGVLDNTEWAFERYTQIAVIANTVGVNTYNQVVNRYDGYARQQIWGSAVSVGSGGTFNAFGGIYYGRGEGYYNDHEPGDDAYNYGTERDESVGSWAQDYRRDEVICLLDDDANVNVYGGYFEGKGGANVFGGDVTGVHVFDGEFKNSKIDKVRCVDADATNDYVYAGITVAQFETSMVITGSYGEIGLDESAYKDWSESGLGIKNAFVNGEARTDGEIVPVKLKDGTASIKFEWNGLSENFEKAGCKLYPVVQYYLGETKGLHPYEVVDNSAIITTPLSYEGQKSTFKFDLYLLMSNGKQVNIGSHTVVVSVEKEEIERVSISLDTLVGGATPANYEGKVNTTGVSIAEEAWYEYNGGSLKKMNDSDKFVEGNQYVYGVTFAFDSGYRFNPFTTVSINGIAARKSGDYFHWTSAVMTAKAELTAKAQNGVTSATVKYNDYAQFVVDVNGGSGSPTYTWTKSEGAPDIVAGGADNQHYIDVKGTKTGTFTYTCVVTDGAETQTVTFTLIVQEQVTYYAAAPDVNGLVGTGNKDVDLLVGESVTLIPDYVLIENNYEVSGSNLTPRKGTISISWWIFTDDDSIGVTITGDQLVVDADVADYLNTSKTGRYYVQIQITNYVDDSEYGKAKRTSHLLNIEVVEPEATGNLGGQIGAEQEESTPYALRRMSARSAESFEGTIVYLVKDEAIVYVTEANADGYYLFTSIPYGSYTVKVEKEGYEDYSKSVEVNQADNDCDITIIKHVCFADEGNERSIPAKQPNCEMGELGNIECRGCISCGKFYDMEGNLIADSAADPGSLNDMGIPYEALLYPVHDYCGEAQEGGNADQYLRHRAETCLEETTYWYYCNNGNCKKSAGDDPSAVDKYYVGSASNQTHSYTVQSTDGDYFKEDTGVDCQDNKWYYYACEYCGLKDSSTVWMSEEKGPHIPHEDDGNCMTAVTCTKCSTTTTEAAASHTPGEDDGDCTTPILCTICGTTTTEAKTNHTAGADDGDCTTAVKCTECDKNAIEAKANHTAGADDGDCTTAVKCTVCDKNAIEAKANHTAGADDGDCTTAVKCTECDKNAIEAKASHTDENTDDKCDTCSKDMPTTPGGDTPGTDEPGTDDPNAGNTEDPTDDNDGLPTGAIIAIVAGSVVVGGAGIFALVWFVIKKKTWAEFLAIFKKG